MSGNADRDRSVTRGDQLIECQISKVKVEASLHSAQMLLLDTVSFLIDGTRDSNDRQLALEYLHGQIRDYLMTSAWVLPPDHHLLEGLSLSGADEGSGGVGEDPPLPSAGEAY